MYTDTLFVWLKMFLKKTMLVGLIIALASCEFGPLKFTIWNVSLDAPDWVPPAEYTFKVVIQMEFSKPVDDATFSAPGSMIVCLNGTNDGRTNCGVSGVFKFSTNYKTVVFISDESLSNLINPQAGENIVYTITLMGNGVNVIKDSDGEILDGDSDGAAGGNYMKTIEVIG